MKQMYSEAVFEHFRNPRNMGEMGNPDGVATVGNPVCGDIMRMYIKVGKRKRRLKFENFIKDIKFQTLGCAAAIATSSVMTTLAKGKSLKEAEKISNQDVVRALGGLPGMKKHCSVLAAEAIGKAIEDYRKRKI